MKCPSCKGGNLKPTEIEVGLVGSGCDQCDGVMLSLVAYRYWAENLGAGFSNDNIDQHVEAQDSKNAKLCAKCGKFMTKYRIGSDSENRVELCGSCDEAWLDSGEWQLLKSMELQGKLAEVFTDVWQNKIRQLEADKNWEETLQEKLGDDGLQKIKAFKTWFQIQENKAEIIQYLLKKG